MVEETQEPLITEDAPESVPGEKVEIVAGDVGKIEDILTTAEETDFDFSPMENKKILERLNSLAKNLSKIGEYYRNPGKTAYCAWRCGNMKGIGFIFLSPKIAKISVGKATRNDNGKIKGEFPKEMYHKITEDGIVDRDGGSITQKEIISQVREYKKVRGW